MKPHTAVLVIGFLLVIVAAGLLRQASVRKILYGWPKSVQIIRYPSSADHRRQPALFYRPAGDQRRPLLVALHTWSRDYLDRSSLAYAQWCIEQGWVFIHPDFRGRNFGPKATGSDFAVADIVSAVEYAKQAASVDTDRIYLIGMSGGGHAALLAAARHPDVWTAVSVWCPISDLASWYDHCVKANLRYAGNIAAACGGTPRLNEGIDAEYRQRSGLSFLREGMPFALDINAGIHDGHTGSVPVDQSIRAFNAAAPGQDRISEADMQTMTRQQQIPDPLKAASGESLAPGKPILFRRQSGTVRLTIFEGGHEAVPRAGLAWLAEQVRAGSQGRPHP